MILPRGFSSVRLVVKGQEVEVPTNIFQPVELPVKPDGTRHTAVEYNCPFCAFTKPTKKDILNHLELDIHLYGFPGGINPFTGEPFVPLIEGLPAEEALEILQAEG